MIDRDELKAQIDAEMSKYEQSEEQNEETKSESSVDEDSSELASESTSINESTNTEPSTQEDPYLKEALEMGYNPNYSGSNRKTPEQFVKDSSFFRKIDELKKENKEVKNLLKQQAEHNKKVERAAYEKALREIQQEKIDKVNEGDVEGFRIVEQKQQAVEEQIKALEPEQPIQPELSENVKNFVERNKYWLNQDSAENKEMAEAALLIDNFIAKQNRELGRQVSEAEHLNLVEERIKRLYPHRFENPNTKKPATVAVSSGGNTKPDVNSKLNNRQKYFLRAAQKYGLDISADEYVKQLKLTGDLRDE